MKNNRKINHISLIVAAVVVLITLVVISATAQTSSQTTVSFTQQFKMGNVAVTDYNSTDGISLYSKSIVRHENNTPDGTVFTYESTASGYPRVSNKDGIFISGTYDNSTIVFYVTETADAIKTLSLKTKNINEAEYFAGITADRITASSVSMAVINSDEDELCWRKIINTSSSDALTTDIDYGDCPFDEEKNAYMIALRVDNGMTCFESMQIAGLEIAEINDCRKTLFYKDGVLMQGSPEDSYEQADSVSQFNLEMIKNVTSCTTDENSIINSERPIIIFLKNLYDFLVRLVNNVLSMFR